MIPTLRRGLALGLLLAAAAGGSSSAEDARSVVFVTWGGTVCVGGNDVMWGERDGRIKRWRRQDGSISDVKVPSLGSDSVGRGVLGCLVRPGGDFDLYYSESYFDPSHQPSDHLSNRIRTVWMSGDRHRVLLDTPAPEGGDREAEIRFLPGLGVGVHDDLTIERIADGLKYKLEVPERTRLHGVWPASRGWPVEPPELVVCYGYGADSIRPGGCAVVRVGASSMEQRPIEFDARDSFLMNQYDYPFPEEPSRRCALKSPASIGYDWPRRAAFDCFDYGKVRYFGVYPVDNGIAVWRPLRSDMICRQRSIDADALVVQAQCYRMEGNEFRAALADALTKGSLGGSFEHAAPSGWTVTLLGRGIERPITGRLVPAND